MVKYDKLKNMETDELIYDFICEKCQINGMKKGNFKIWPVGVSYRDDLSDNTDINNKELKKGYDTLPTYREAVIEAFTKTTDNTYVVIQCNHCGEFVGLDKKISLVMLKKWLNKNTEYIMRL